MKTTMIQSAERILVVGDRTAIGAALIQRLLHLGHPRSHIQVASKAAASWSDGKAVHAFMRDEQPDLVYLVDAAGCPFEAETGGSSSTELISAAAQAGVARLMYVGTAASSTDERTPHPSRTSKSLADGRHTAALQLCNSFASQGLDYRSVLTCEPYGPCGPSKAPTDTSRAAYFIESLLLQFTDAVARSLDRVTIQPYPYDRLEMMYLNDIAEAVVYVMDLPRATLLSTTRQSSLHVDIGAEQVVRILELINAAAAAVGFRGTFLLNPEPIARCSPRLDNHRLADLGWRPLISLETGLELTSMEFRLRHRAFQSGLCTT